MNDFDVDAVVTFVDQNDFVWQQNFKKTKEELASKNQIPKLAESVSNNRFSNHDELEICLFCIRKNMPWIRKIWLVVSNKEQVPEYTKNYNVEVVLHKNIIPQEFLPLFNSCAIELFLHKIPGLSEHWVYFNDDFFVCKPTEKAYFFTEDGRPINGFKKTYQKKCMLNTSWYPSFMNAYRLACTTANTKPVKDDFVIELWHHVKALRTSFCEDLWKKCHDQLVSSITPFRSEKSINGYVFSLYDWLTNRCIQRGWKDTTSLFQLNASKQFVCYNDNQQSNIDVELNNFRYKIGLPTRAMDKYAVAININNNNVKEIELCVKSIRQFNPDLKVFALTMGSMQESTLELCRQLGVQTLDCDMLFDQKFPWFKAHNTDVAWRGGKGRTSTIKKYAYGRYLIPYCEELKRFDKVLYIDTDVVAVGNLLPAFSAYSNKIATCLTDGQSRAQSSNAKVYWELKKYDKYGFMKSHWCSGVIMFNMTNILLGGEYEKFMQRMDNAIETIYKNTGKIYNDQDMMNLCMGVDECGGLVSSAFGWQPNTILYHYYAIKSNQEFWQRLKKKLDKYNKNVAIVNEKIKNNQLIHDQTNKPRLSVLTPIRNAGELLSNYLHHIQLLHDALNGNIEFVVVDGSTDGTFEKLQEFKTQHPTWNFKLIYESRKSIGLARNLCLDNATGRFIQFYDHDDKLYVDNVVKLLEIAESPKYYDINIFAGFGDATNNTNKLVEFKKKHPDFQFGKTFNRHIIYDVMCKVYTTRLLFRHDWLLNKNIIRFDENVSPGEDLVFIYNITTTQSTIYIADLLIYTYRVWEKWNQKWPMNEYTKKQNLLATKRLKEYMQIKQPMSITTNQNDIDMVLAKKLGAKLVEKFDTIVVIGTIKNKYVQRNATLRALGALGVLTPENLATGKVIIQNDQPNNIRRKFYDEQNCEKRNFRRLQAYILYNHYFALQDAFYYGAENALILEDDIILNKNLQLCIDMLDNMPENWDFINFCASRTCNNLFQPANVRTTEQKRQALQNMLKGEGNEHFAKLTTTVRNDTCCAMSKRFIDALRKKIEEQFNLVGKQPLINDQYHTAKLFPGMNMYISRKPLCAQIRYSESNSPNTIYNECYSAYNMKLDDFIIF